MTSTLARSESDSTRGGPDHDKSAESRAWVRKLGLGAALFAAVIPAWVLLAWATGNPLWAGTPGTWAVMPPWACVLYLLEAVAAALLVTGRTTTAGAIFLLALVIGAVLLTEGVRDSASGLRLLLWPDRLAASQYELPGLPSRFALITIVLLALAGILSGRQSDLSVTVTTMLAVVALISLAVVVSYVYGVTEARTSDIDIHMALTAALAAAATTVAIAAAQPKRVPMSLIQRPRCWGSASVSC